MVFPLHKSSSRIGTRLARVVCALVLLAFMVPSMPCHARRRALFLLGGFHQWMDMTYQYNGRSIEVDGGRNSTSRQQEFEENYHFEGSYGILSRRLLNGSFAIDLGLDQSLSGGSQGATGGDSSGVSLQYQIDGTFLDHSVYPTSFYSIRQQERVTNPFSRSYDLDRINSGVAVAVRHAILPLNLSYRTQSYATDGLSVDRKQQLDEFSLNVSHLLDSLSRTTLNFKRQKDSTSFSDGIPEQKTSGYEIWGRNTLTWGEEVPRLSLDSSYQYRRETGFREQFYSRWEEALEQYLGRALTFGATHSLNKNETPTQSRLDNRDRAWIEHHLFKSLTTRFEGFINSVDYSSGNEDQNGWRARLAYNKDLPGQNRLNLSYGYSRQLTDRNLTEQSLFVSGEQLTVSLTDNFLLNPDVIAGTVRVFDSGRTIEFVEGVDYQLIVVGRLTEIIPLSPFMPTGSVLSIDYSFAVNNSIKFSTDSHYVSGSLALLDNRHRIYGNFTSTDQTMVSGRADVAPLTQQKSYQLGFESSFDTSTVGGSYVYLDSTLEESRAWEGFWRFQELIGLGILHVQLADRYSELQSSSLMGEQTGRGGGQNSVTLLGNYNIRLLRRGNLMLRSQYLNLRGRGTQEDDLTLGASLEFRYGKFETRLLSDVTWKWQDRVREREDYLYLSVRRYF